MIPLHLGGGVAKAMGVLLGTLGQTSVLTFISFTTIVIIL
jgi:hypothetical protein